MGRYARAKAKRRKPKPAYSQSKHGYTVRNRNLAALGFASYSAYLKSDIWKEVKRLAFEEHGRKCVKCQSAATEIHHSSYDLNTLVGSNLQYLHPVCRECHESAEVTPLGSKVKFLKANKALGVKSKGITTNDEREAQALLDNKRIRKGRKKRNRERK